MQNKDQLPKIAIGGTCLLLLVAFVAIYISMTGSDSEKIIAVTGGQERTFTLAGSRVHGKIHPALGLNPNENNNSGTP